jgi:alkaline phosphatase
VIGAGHPAYSPGFIDETDYQALKNGTTGQGWTFVEQKAGVNGADSLKSTASKATKLFGLYGGRSGNIPYRLANGSRRNIENPTLADITRAALTVLGKNRNGMFLMVEGGAIDWAAHANDIDEMIGEVIDFDKAVASVKQWVDSVDPTWKDTLLIVTADHETGYLTRGSGIFPNVLLGNPGAGVLPVAGTHFSWNSKNHTNSLVPLYAKGDGAEMLSHYATAIDPGRAMRYLDNTDVSKVMQAAIVTKSSTIPRKAGIIQHD